MELEGINQIRLRTFEKEDQIPMAMLCNNRNIWNNLRDFIPSPYTESDARQFIDYCLSEDPARTFAISREGIFCGTIGLVLQQDVYRLSAELGYWIGEAFWGKGIATEAVKLITKYGFEELGLIRIHAGVFDFNTASRRVLEKAGFSLESIHKQAVIKNDRICDEYRYCLLR